MAKIVSIIEYVGKAGNTVGQKSPKGGVILKQKAASVSNPQTSKQMNHRARFKLATVVTSMLGEVGRVALQANGYKKSERGELVKRIMRFVEVNQNQAELNYHLRLVNNPSYRESITVAVSATENAYVATFSGASTGEVIAKAILVYDQTTGIWRHATALDTLDTIGIGKDANEAGHSIEVYAYGIVLEPKTELARTNLSEVRGYPGGEPNTAGSNNIEVRNGVGYIVSVEGITSENYDFSPTISALLTIAGDGSQSGGTGGSSSSTGSNTGSNTGGNGSGNSSQGTTEPSGNPVLTISTSGSGSATVSAGGSTLNSGAQVAANTEVSLSVTPATGQTPTANINGTNITLTDNSGTYTGTFQMPAANATLVINTGSAEGYGDTN